MHRIAAILLSVSYLIGARGYGAGADAKADAWGDPVMGVIAQLKPMAKHKTAPFAFEVTVKNTDNEAISLGLMGEGHSWRFKFTPQAVPGETYEVILQSGGGLPKLAMLAKNQTNVAQVPARILMVTRNGYRVQPKNLPPGKYNVVAVHTARKNKISLFGKSNDDKRQLEGTLSTAPIEVEIKAEDVAVGEGKDGFGGVKHGLAAKLTLLKSEGRQLAFEVLTRNTGSAPAFIDYMCRPDKPRSWTLIFENAEKPDEWYRVHTQIDSVSKNELLCIERNSGTRAVLTLKPDAKQSDCYFMPPKESLNATEWKDLPPGKYRVRAKFSAADYTTTTGAITGRHARVPAWEGSLYSNEIEVEIK